MKTQDISIVFFGTSEFSVLTLQQLVSAGYHVAAVVTKPDARSGRGRKLTLPPVAKAAGKLGLPLIQPHRVADINDELESLAPSIGVVAAYGKLLPPTTLKLFPHGLVNIHPSLLPQYRGPSPVATAILDGIGQTGVTLMEVIEAMDAGGIFDQQAVNLKGIETTLTLTRQLFELGAERLIKVLPDIVAGKLKPRPQDDQKATYTELFSRTQAALDWNETAIQNERKIRAFVGWINAYADINDLHLVVTAASVLKSQGAPGQLFTTEDKKLAIYCAQDALAIERVKPAGRAEMDGQAFLAGYSDQLEL